MNTHRLDNVLACIAGEFSAPPGRIVILGAGDCDECAVVIAHFPASHITAIDIVPGTMRRVRQRFGPKGVEVLEGDAADILPNLPSFKLAIVRHPDVDRQPVGWANTLTACAFHLAPDGVLVLTAYAFHEAERLRAHMDTCCPSLFAQSVDPTAPVAISGADRYILVYVKREPEGS